MNDLLHYYQQLGVSVAVGDAPNNRLQVGIQNASVQTSQPVNAAGDVDEDVKHSIEKPKSPPVRVTSSAAKEHPAYACTSLAELQTAQMNYKACDLALTATNMVFADGNPEAEVMLIGEAPGADEDRIGKPFVGQSGQLLDKILATIGLARSNNLYISNIIPWRPPGNRPPTPDEAAQCEPFIRQHVKLVQPKLIILAGGTAAKTILKTKLGIVKLRGQLHEVDFNGTASMVVPTFHPAYLLRSPGQKAQIWRDMLFIKNKMRTLGIQ